MANKKYNLDDYLEVPNHKFQFIKVGDYIRWNFVNKGILTKKITAGGTITRIGLTYKGRKNWLIEGFGEKMYTLYWDLYESIYVRHNITYVALHKQINILSQMLVELAVELGVKNKLGEIGAKVTKKIQKTEIEKKEKEIVKRKKKGITPIVRGRSVDSLIKRKEL